MNQQAKAFRLGVERVRILLLGLAAVRVSPDEFMAVVESASDSAESFYPQRQDDAPFTPDELAAIGRYASTMAMGSFNAAESKDVTDKRPLRKVGRFWSAIAEKCAALGGQS